MSADSFLAETTSDPDVHLIVDGQRVNATSTGEQVYRFELPAAPATLVIGSRSVTPADMDAQALDARRLGVSFTRMVLRSRGAQVEIGHDHPLLVEGFHAHEESHRWTNGAGAIPAQLLGALAGPVQVELHIAALATQYQKPFEAPARKAAKSSSRRRSAGKLQLGA